MVIIAFYYCIRVGEYTTASNKKPKPTIALRDCDVCLWREGRVIPHSAGRARLLTMDSATICISHTKNETKGAVVHLDCGLGPICPVAALARRIANMQGGLTSGSLSLVYHPSGRVTRVSDRDIGIAVHWGATNDRLLARGNTLHCISSHSLFGGGHGYDTKWSIGQHNHLSGTLDISDVSNIHPLSDWQPHGWLCCKNVNSIHAPECRISHAMVGSLVGWSAGLRMGPQL